MVMVGCQQSYRADVPLLPPRIRLFDISLPHDVTFNIGFNFAVHLYFLFSIIKLLDFFIQLDPSHACDLNSLDTA